MARPLKDGVDFFSLDCQMDDEIKYIEAEFGLDGFATVIKLWQAIYGNKGYYMVFTRTVRLMFANSIGKGVGFVDEVVARCMDYGVFDRQIYKKYGVLTSVGVQKRYAKMTERRNLLKIDGRYLLISAPENWVIDSENLINVDNNGENATENTESKVKESKEKNSITTTTAPVREKKANTEALGYHVPPERESVVDYFKKLGVSEPEGEADAFIKYNEGIGWVCLPVWVTAADSWAEKIRPRRKGKKAGSGELARSFDTGEFFDAATSRTYKGKGGKG